MTPTNKSSIGRLGKNVTATRFSTYRRRGRGYSSSESLFVVVLGRTIGLLDPISALVPVLLSVLVVLVVVDVLVVVVLSRRGCDRSFFLVVIVAGTFFLWKTVEKVSAFLVLFVTYNYAVIFV